MLVKTPAIKLAVEVRSVDVEDGRLTLRGVANNMPCSVQIGGDEFRALSAMMLRAPIISFALRSLVSRKRSHGSTNEGR